MNSVRLIADSLTATTGLVRSSGWQRCPQIGQLGDLISDSFTFQVARLGWAERADLPQIFGFLPWNCHHFADATDIGRMSNYYCVSARVSRIIPIPKRLHRDDLIGPWQLTRRLLVRYIRAAGKPSSNYHGKLQWPLSPMLRTGILSTTRGNVKR